MSKPTNAQRRVLGLLEEGGLRLFAPKTGRAWVGLHTVWPGTVRVLRREAWVMPIGFDEYKIAKAGLAALGTA